MRSARKPPCGAPSGQASSRPSATARAVGFSPRRKRTSCASTSNASERLPDTLMRLDPHLDRLLDCVVETVVERLLVREATAREMTNLETLGEAGKPLRGEEEGIRNGNDTRAAEQPQR